MEVVMGMEGVPGRLRWIRAERLRLSTTEMAQRLTAAGVATSNASISRYEREPERGGRVPPVDYVAGVCAYAGVSVAWAVSGQGSPEAVDSDDVAGRVIADMRLHLDQLELRYGQNVRAVPAAADASATVLAALARAHELLEEERQRLASRRAAT
jgi:hypothetical protein